MIDSALPAKVCLNLSYLVKTYNESKYALLYYIKSTYCFP